MKRFSRFIVKNHIGMLAVSLILLIAAIIGMTVTRINYDILS